MFKLNWMLVYHFKVRRGLVIPNKNPLLRQDTTTSQEVNVWAGKLIFFFPRVFFGTRFHLYYSSLLGQQPCSLQSKPLCPLHNILGLLSLFCYSTILSSGQHTDAWCLDFLHGPAMFSPLSFIVCCACFSCFKRLFHFYVACCCFCCVRHYGRIDTVKVFTFAWFILLKMEAVCSSETMIPAYGNFKSFYLLHIWLLLLKIHWCYLCSQSFEIHFLFSDFVLNLSQCNGTYCYFICLHKI